jgi:hypothetical protein
MNQVSRAYARLYNRPTLEKALKDALADYASGKLMTSISFEGESSGAAVRGDPRQIIADLEAALDLLDGVGAPSITASDFSRRIFAS